MAIYIHAQDLTIRFYKTKITLKLSHLSWFWPGPHCCSHTPSWETRPPASGKVSCAASPVGRWKAPWSILQSLQDKGYNTADRVLAGRAVRKVLLSVHYGSTWFECHIKKKKKNPSSDLYLLPATQTFAHKSYSRQRVTSHSSWLAVATQHKQARYNANTNNQFLS